MAMGHGHPVRYGDRLAATREIQTALYCEVNRRGALDNILPVVHELLTPPGNRAAGTRPEPSPQLLRLLLNLRVGSGGSV